MTTKTTTKYEIGLPPTFSTNPMGGAERKREHMEIEGGYFAVQGGLLYVYEGERPEARDPWEAYPTPLPENRELIVLAEGAWTYIRVVD